MFVERKKYDYENLFDYYFELLNYLILNIID
jgi:hypothetical protein